MRRSEQGYNLRAKERRTIFECYNVEESDLQHNDDSDHGWTRKRLREKKKPPHWQEEDYEYNLEESNGEDLDIFDSQEVIDRLPSDPHELANLLNAVKGKLKLYKQQFLREQQELKGTPVLT